MFFNTFIILYDKYYKNLYHYKPNFMEKKHSDLINFYKKITFEIKKTTIK